MDCVSMPLSVVMPPAASALVLPDCSAMAVAELSKCAATERPVKRQHVEGASLTDLGEDLLLRVLQLAQLPVRDLCRYACVNRTWKRACYAPCLWQRVRIGLSTMREGVEMVASRCSVLTELYIDDPRCELHILHPIIVACGPTLRRIVIDCDKDSTSRNEASISSILWIISLYCKGVESIKLTSDGREGTFGFLENKAMWYLTAGFRSMRSFSCSCLNSVTKQSIYLIVIAWRELHTLSIHCGSLQMEDLMALKKCYTLRRLEVIGGRAGLITPQHWDAVMHRELEEITFTQSAVCTADVLQLIRLCPALREVRINFWDCPWESLEDRATCREGLRALQDRLGGRHALKITLK